MMTRLQVKGFGGAEERREVVARAVRDVGLSEKVHTAAKSLSGGMKRKLCLANALLGDPGCVFLDEPTSGMDPYSRRATWDLVRNFKVPGQMRPSPKE